MVNEKVTEITPLFNINVLRFAITLATKKSLNISDIGSDFRGKLGFSIKQISCQYDQFQKVDCSECSISDNCYYISLFSPISSLQVSKDGNGCVTCNFVD